MGLDVTQPVFGVSDKAGFKPVSSAIETSLKIEILPVASLHTVHSKKPITKATIRLWGCTGWSVPLLFAKPGDRFSRVEANIQGDSSHHSLTVSCFKVLKDFIKFDESSKCY